MKKRFGLMALRGLKSFDKATLVAMLTVYGYGSGTYTGSIKVSAYRSDGTTVFKSILNVVNGYSTPSIISGYTGTFPGKGKARDAEVAWLRKEAADLRETNEILQKAMAFFVVKPR